MIDPLRVRIALGDRSHDVLVGRGALSAAAGEIAAIARTREVAVIADEHVDDLHGAQLTRSWESAGVRTGTIRIPRGESAKALGIVESVCRTLAARRHEREDLVVGFGGGAATDTAAFVSAVFLRGVPYVAVPTSLLGMVDAAIGGKSAVDLPEGKNLVGAIRQPRLVVADLAFLDTLPVREIRAGFAEMIKIAWIADAKLFTELEETSGEVLDEVARDPSIVARCVALKGGIVARDELEQGERAVLNFGHTWGHAIETEARGALLHGECVALGMVAAVFCSAELGQCPRSELERLVRFLERVGLPTHRAEIDVDAVSTRMLSDKKRRHGGTRAVLTAGVGSVSVADHVSEDAVRRAVTFLRREGTRCDLSLE
jgi:3-dehydroquinate synthase